MRWSSLASTSPTWPYRSSNSSPWNTNWRSIRHSFSSSFIPCSMIPFVSYFLFLIFLSDFFVANMGVGGQEEPTGDVGCGRGATQDDRRANRRAESDLSLPLPLSQSFTSSLWISCLAHTHTQRERESD